ncbi:unnamed protein product, partial [Oppiella nova]
MFSMKRLLLYITFRNSSTYSILLYITGITFIVIVLSVLTLNNFDINLNTIRKYYSKHGFNGSIVFETNVIHETTSDETFVIRHNSETNAAKVVYKPLVPKLSPKVHQRLWFLTNGTGRLGPVEAAQLALWPEESTPSDDRVVNQLLYVPLDYEKTADKHKTIYLSASDNDWRLSLGRKEFLRCPVSTCQLVPRSHAQKADLIFFKNRYGFREFEVNRNPDQIWAKFEIESPANIQLIGPDNQINWTVTYRHDSEIPTPYYKFYEYERSATKSIIPPVNYAFNKTKKVAWFVSNCFANNKRLEYAKELAKHIQVDIYGRCGSMDCSKSDNDLCQQMVDKDYKFYLSFENSNCLDYITEKFWFNGLMHSVIPIVMGAHPLTYKRLAPPHSYIHVDDYKSPKHLASYLHKLDSNDQLYNEYFAWKGTGDLREIYMWCRLCALLHAPKSERYYKSLGQWWQTSDTCVPTTWTD